MAATGAPSSGSGLSRRSFLRAAGLGASALSLSAILAVCADEGDGGTQTPEAYDWTKQRQAGAVTFVNWPLYIDKARVNGEVVHPTLTAFTDATGIDVEYEELIEDYGSFFGKIEPQLRTGVPTGFDLIVMGYPKWLPLMMSRGFLVPLDHSYLQNFERHAAPKYKEATYDPGNACGRCGAAPAAPSSARRWRTTPRPSPRRSARSSGTWGSTRGVSRSRSSRGGRSSPTRASISRPS